uniref:preprotein translocase subunit SecA n=1 Tax=Pseudoerythrocladia kornmannii TaxID=753682 RepID=UPI001BEEDBA6|nr:preprotein translocase subunit SecA [Pseudoerythrocladia kornmannii]QUE28341.1 SecA [Pseudoerythrocladia kornmannii]UNJ16846.1 preprotein translocase subunit SecA [Pseudoerythrocladia kornmannii]
MLNTIFKSNSQRQVEKYSAIIKKINHYQENFQDLPQSDLQKQTLKIKHKIANGANLDDLIPEAFALVKEASKRVLGLNIYNVQLIAGIVLHHGQIAEMKTGEGKTLAAALPAYLNSLTNNGIHIITVNDYLAKRDASVIGKIYKFLGLSVGLIQENMNQNERKYNYNCDITYVTNSEIAFDYLRDNMALVSSDVVHRPFYYAIVDEVDSIFIDEARTPLIIGGESESNNSKYDKTAEVVKSLQINTDYEVDYKRRTITLTESGINNTELLLNIQDIYDLHNPWAPYLMNSLKAKELYKIGINYLVIEEQIVIVDEFTGRISQGRRWSEGLHQAIEAKENVPIQKEMKTLASITYQNFFLLYPKLAGMTGTAKTEDYEFEKIYKMQVTVIPTNKEMIRQDFPDLLYKNQYSKWKAVVVECREMYLKGRPTLIGTTSISNSQLVSYLLKECGIDHNVLNARPQNAIREGEIIAQAGRKQAVTIATNMAGRGTDIILGGNAVQLANTAFLEILKEIIKSNNILNEKLISEILLRNIEKYNKLETSKQTKIISTIIQNTKYFSNNAELEEEALIYLQENRQDKQSKHEILDTLWTQIYCEYHNLVSLEKAEVIKLGGVHIIGTERHDSRRIDNQLRGRAGRQGDPGSSRFFLSLDDKLLKNFGGSKIVNVMNTLQLEDDIPIESRILNSFLDTAQQKVESYYYDIRKHVFDYDQVLNDHRKAIYAERKRILETQNLRKHILGYGEATIADLVNYYIEAHNTSQTENTPQILEAISKLLNIKNDFHDRELRELTSSELNAIFQEQIYISYDLKEAFLESLQPGLTRQLEKYTLLTQIDECWTEHLQKMNALQEIISWRSYGQNDPLIEYKRESFILFCKLLQTVFQSVIYMMMRVEELE